MQQLQRVIRHLQELPAAEHPQGSITAALLDCLERLQPVAAAAGTALPSESPAAVLRALRRRCGPNVLSADGEHDAVEAYEVLLGLVCAEVQAAFGPGARAPPGLPALLRPPGNPSLLPALSMLGASQQQAQQPEPRQNGVHVGSEAGSSSSLCSELGRATPAPAAASDSAGSSKRSGEAAGGEQACSDQDQEPGASQGQEPGPAASSGVEEGRQPDQPSGAADGPLASWKALTRLVCQVGGSSKCPAEAGVEAPAAPASSSRWRF